MLSALASESNKTYTENGALSNRSTNNHCLNFFATCGALRNQPETVALRLFARAYVESPDLAMRTLFYARDIRGGLGERELFRDILSWLARKRPHSVRKNIDLIPEYGRWDDLLALMETPCEKDVVDRIQHQLRDDLNALDADGQVSLLAKWLPSVNTASSETKLRARRLCKLLGMTEREYRRTLSRLRARIDILEHRLCRKDYSFDYSRQPSGALHKYREAFLRHDRERYRAFLDAVLRGEKTLHAGTIYPYEIIRACLPEFRDWSFGPLRSKTLSPEMIQSLDASWNSLPDYGDRSNSLAVIDGSGSMFDGGNPLPAEVALSLGIYFAEHNTGFFRNHFITFSHTPRLVELKGDNIVDRTEYCMSFDECSNTNLRATFGLILEAALENGLSQEDLPETLYIISDMELDEGVDTDKTLFHEIKEVFEARGYRLPTLVYWNVNSRSEQFPVSKDENGTVLVSGASPSLFQMVIGQDVSPESFMLSVLNSPRYIGITA